MTKKERKRVLEPMSKKLPSTTFAAFTSKSPTTSISVRPNLPLICSDCLSQNSMQASFSILNFIASFSFQGMLILFKNILKSHRSCMGLSRSSLSDVEGAGDGSSSEEGCQVYANQIGVECEQRVSPCTEMFTREDMDRVMERLGMRKEAEETQRRRWNWRCQDCTFLQGVSLLEEKEASMDELKGAFSVFDENGDGFITEAELQEVMNKLELKEGKELENCRKMIRTFDKNGDGKIDLEEFKFLLENTV